VKQHAYDFDSEFNDPAIWNVASHTEHPIDILEPLPDARDPYRAAALDHLRVLLAIDAFMTDSENPRLAWITVAITFNLTSVRQLSVSGIANQLGVSAATLRCSMAKFLEMAGLDLPDRFGRFRRGLELCFLLMFG
jgi:hypothetical protein